MLLNAIVVIGIKINTQQEGVWGWMLRVLSSYIGGRAKRWGSVLSTLRFFSWVSKPIPGEGRAWAYWDYWWCKKNDRANLSARSP